MSFRTPRRALAAPALLSALALAACTGDSTGTSRITFEAAVVVNSVGNSLSVIPTNGILAPTAIGLGSQGSPVSVATRDNVAVVPMGTYPFAALVDLGTQQVRFATLPAGSGATGAAFVNDSVAVVANPDLNTISPVNVRSGAVAAPLAAGVYPQAVVATASRVFVIDANLVNFAPAGRGTVTVFDAGLNRLGTVQLSGFNSTAGIVVGGTLYVVNAGHFGQHDGSLSVVDIASLSETRHVPGFGEFPGSIGVSIDGRVYVGVYGTGILAWNPSTGAFERDAAHPIVPTGSTAVSALGFDAVGRLYTADPGDCKANGKLYRVTSETLANQAAATGVCPFALSFTHVTVGN